MIIPRLLTGHSAVYPLVAAFALTLVFIACGGGSASGHFATAAPANMPTNTIIPTNSISAPTPVATQTVQPLATVRAATVLEPTLTPAPDNEDTVTAAGGFSMGGAALGGSAETTLLAQETLVEVPDGPLAWVAHEFTLAYGQSIEHVHEFAFVYAVEGPHQLLGRQDEHNLTSGEGAVVLAGAPHQHAAPAGQSVFWEVRLTKPGSAPAANLANPTLVFDSGPLRDIPVSPMATFALVRVPVDGETSVHTHPGPELIYQLSGKIDYQNALIGTKLMGPGGIEGIPQLVSVQKRNPYEKDAEFLSWFLVDANQPFASPSVFADVLEESAALEYNPGSPVQNVRIVAVSSNYGGGANDSSFGADRALDGNPASAWSSNGDGSDAWLEIELPSETRVSSLGFWSRTMGSSAQIFSFRVVSDSGEIAGPFTLEDASRIFYYDTKITRKRQRFEAVDTSGGKTGAMEIEVYGDPLP